jgi:hypothetical protein
MLNNENGLGRASANPLEQWLTPGRFLCILGLLIFAAFPQVLLGIHSFAYRDYGLFGYPLAHYFRDSFWRGELPLWNPYNDLGTPFLAQWGTMVLYPPSLIYLLLPLPWSLSLFCLLHLFFGGIGMYVLTSRWTDNRLAGGVAGIGFAFSGLALNCLMWPNYTATLAWMPWVIYGVREAWQGGGRKILWASLAGAAQMLSGTPEVILFTWLIVAGLWLGTSMRTWSEVWVSGRRALWVVLLVSALSAAQLLPFLELLSHSHRDRNFDSGQWPVPLWGWANLFVPMFRLFGTGCGVHFQYNQMFTSSIYSGIFVMALAILAAVCCRDRRPWFFLLVAFGGLILSLGEAGGLYPFLRKGFPQIGFMRYTSKFVILMTFAWPVVAAFGLAAWLRVAPGESMGRRFRLLIAVTALVSLVAVGIIVFSHYRPFSREEVSKTLINGLTRIGLLWAIAGALVLLVRMQGSHREWLLHCFVLLLVWMDYMSHMPQQNPTLEGQALTIKMPRIEELDPRPRLGESRAALTIHARTVFTRAGTSNLTQTYLCLRNGLLANANLIDKIPKVDGFYALWIREARDVELRLFKTDDDVRPGLGRFMGISQLTSDTNLMAWEAQPGYLPMVTAGQQPVFLSSGKTLAALMNTNFSPETVVFLPETARGRIRATNSGTARVISSTVREHRVEAEIEASQPSMVVVAQTFYPGWRARVDGQPAPLWRANHAFQALEVGAGRHRVELVYKDNRFLLGSCIGALALAGMGASFFRVSKKCTTGALDRDTGTAAAHAGSGVEAPASAKTGVNAGTSAGSEAMA